MSYQPDYDFSDFSFRSHYLGLLMTQPKGKSNLEKYNEAFDLYEQYNSAYNLSNKESKTGIKSGELMKKWSDEVDRLEPIKDIPHLSATCKSKLREIYISTRTGRTKNIEGKYLEKGLRMEEDGITAYCLNSGEMLEKNTVRKDNGFINGCCDIEKTVSIVDTKCSWDIFTFEANKFNTINPIYEWQGQSYMWLYNKPEFELAYILLNTPKNIVDKEIKKLEWNFVGSLEEYNFALEELLKLHNYDDIPAKDKIYIIKTKSSEEKIEQIKAGVKTWRDFLCSGCKDSELTETETE